MNNRSRSQIISKILSPALGLWLKSQVERLEALEIEIAGADRAIIRGELESVFLASRQVVYQGLALGQVQLKGEKIRLNLNQVIKGQPLRLLEPVPVAAQISLEESQLRASLSSALLCEALTDLLFAICHPNYQHQVYWQDATLAQEQVTLTGTLIAQNQKRASLMIRSGVAIANPHTLRLQHLQVTTVPKLFTTHLSEFELDLGTDVELKEISLAPGRLFCSGCLNIRP